MPLVEIMKKLKGLPQPQTAGEAFSKLTQQEQQQMEELIGRTWGRTLKHNKALVHLDLSNNHFSEATCRLLGRKLTKNHTIYGLHLAGNCCSVDSQGFVVVDEAITQAYVAREKEQAAQ